MKLFCVFVLSLVSSFSQAGVLCEKELAHAARVFQEEIFDSGFWCLYQIGASDQFAAVSIFIKDGHSTVHGFTSFKLVDLEDAQESQNLPRITGMGQDIRIMWEYPSGVELISLCVDSNVLKVTGAEKSIRLSTNLLSGDTLSISFDAPASKVFDISFEDLQPELILKSKDLVLVQSSNKIRAVVSVDKASLYNLPALSSKGRMYLVGGDVVSILDYQSGFLQVLYRHGNKRDITKWLRLESVL